MSNVKAIFQPNAQRIADVRRWFVEQAVCDDHVAALSVAMTADGRVVTSGSSIEPEHAVVMLGELRALILRIESQLPEQDYPVHSGNVVPLRR